MSEATNNNPTAGTLSAVAAALGEIEPREGDATPAGAVHGPQGVCSPNDAALALSVVSDVLGEIHCYDLCEAERNVRLDDVSAIHEQIVRWLIESYGARPLRSTWAEDFEAQAAD